MSTSSTFNNASPIFNLDNSLSNLIDDLNLNSKQDDPFCYSTYYYFPSPLSNYNELDGLDDFVHHYHHHDQLDRSIEQVIRTTSPAITDDSSIFEVDNNKMGSSKVEQVNTTNIKRPCATSNGSKRRRSTNKDRHSKIRTAQGLRDRRIRLSLEVAHPFFKLQDMLGYDKASRTVKWLLVQSKQAIEEVIMSNKKGSPSEATKCTISSISDCEVESMTIDHETNKTNNCQKMTKISLSSSTSGSKSKVKVKPNRATKESRTEARARARERTRKRLIVTTSQANDKEDYVGNSQLLGGSSSFELREIDHGDSNSRSSYSNGVYYPSIGFSDQVNGSLSGNWNSLFTTFGYQPKW